MHRNSPVPTSVYIIESGDFCKIGVAIDPEKRLKELKTGSPVRPRIYKTRQFLTGEDAYKVEARMHREFYWQRGHGEWFKITPERAWAKLRTMRVPKTRLPEREEVLAALEAVGTAPDRA